MRTKRKTAKRILAALLAMLALLALGVGLYAGDYYHADGVAVAALASSGKVTVEQEKDMVVFRPEAPATTGFIFYPGGKVEFTAYAPLLLELAQQGIQCVLPEMPLNLAVLDLNAAEGIREQYPEIQTWYIGGHSLGGSMAASYAAKNARDFAGLILLASYSTADLRESGLKVLSVYGSEDGVLNMEKYREYSAILPEDTVETVIPGGNHAGFGSYGAQEGDGAAAISQQEQVQQTAAAIAAFAAGS